MFPYSLVIDFGCPALSFAGAHLTRAKESAKEGQFRTALEASPYPPKGIDTSSPLLGRNWTRSYL
jgi:hypothetical protein